MVQVIGAGFGRTGTLSIKSALQRLLGGRCYHMAEVFTHQEHVSTWIAAARGDTVDYQSLLDDYVATVDWLRAPFGASSWSPSRRRACCSRFDRQISGMRAMPTRSTRS